MKFMFLLSLAAIAIFCCESRDKHGRIIDTPTTGSITIAVDESLRPLIEAEVNAFESLYPNADIRLVFTGEQEAIELLLKDTARMSIVTRRLAGPEENLLLKETIRPVQLKCATSGIALICNPNATDSLIDLSTFKQMLSVQKESLGEIFSGQIVFDQPNSGIVRYLRDTLRLSDSLSRHCFAVKSNAKVVEYVSKNQMALGLIDLSWISDQDDSTANEFLEIINVLAIRSDSGYYQPYQAYIAQGKYPLSRDVILISREARSGLASGFMAFVASDRGQRIVLKSGLVPATMPIRILEVNHEPL